ncbi:MAG: SHOCT domain-containing protein [Chloroflexi bacterium]|nr:SHOCT domain-containing protein [Chloroflexota bacterium]
MMWNGFQGTGWLWMLFGSVWMILFWGAIIALVVWGIKALTRSETPSATRRDPLDIVKERYARGEISREEFEQLKKDLS